MLKKFVGMVFKLLSVCLWASQSHLKHRTRDTTYTHTHTHIQSAWQKCKLIIKIYIKKNKGCSRNTWNERKISEKKNKTKWQTKGPQMWNQPSMTTRHNDKWKITSGTSILENVSGCCHAKGANHKCVWCVHISVNWVFREVSVARPVVWRLNLLE